MNLRPIVWLCLVAGAGLPAARGLANPAGGAREIVPIAAGWRFQLDVYDLGEKEQWHANGFDRSAWAEVSVPKAWDLFDEALWGYEGIGWYATAVPGAWARKNAVQRLIFGRVNYHTRVWLNGEFLGENANGYLPFEFDVSGKLKPEGANLLVLRVDNRPRLEWLPGARQIEWIQYGGILEPVRLETSPPVYISDLTINAVPDGAGASVACTVEITSRAAAETGVVLRAGVTGHDETAQSLRFRVAPGARTVRSLSLSLAQASPWSPDSPSLYSLAASLEAGGQTDSITARFGVRKIEARGREILLNGRRFRVKGVNRYDEYGKYGPAPPRDLLVEDLRRMKNAGVNFVRVHYPQSPEILSLYDEMGFVMSEEVPLNWWGNGFSGKGEEVQSDAILSQAMPALERMIQRDKNHPSVIIWSMCNESQTANEVGIRVMRRLIRRTRELDKSRLVTFVISTQEAKEHKAFEDADLVAINVYSGQFGARIARHTGELSELVTRPSAEHIRRQLAAFPGKPLLITEFGTRGVPGIHGDIAYSEDFQAAFIQAAWKAIEECAEASGGVLWSWADYYHRRTFIQYAVFGPYGVVTVDRRPKAALAALTAMYGGRQALYKDIPRDYLAEADSIPGFWINTVDGVSRFLNERVRKGSVRQFGTTAGGRPMRAAFYGEPRGAGGTTTFSGSLGFGDVRAYFGPEHARKVYMAIGAVHGGEVEGITGLVNLLAVLETGADLRGKPWPAITAAAAALDRIILIPIVNADGRARVPYRMLRFRGANEDVQEYFNTGGWKDGKLIGWPGCKQFIPLDFSKTGFPGGYPNDAGVNIQHDDFFGRPQPETRALLELAARERPDLILNMHTGATFTTLLREFIEPSLTPAFEELYRRVHTALTRAKLRGSDDAAREADPAGTRLGVFNLSTALNLNSGALAVLIESPSHSASKATRNGQPFRHTPDDIVDAQLTCHQEAMRFLAETGGRANWTKK